MHRRAPVRPDLRATLRGNHARIDELLAQWSASGRLPVGNVAPRPDPHARPRQMRRPPGKPPKPPAFPSLEAAVAAAARRDTFLRDHPPVVEWWGGRFLPASTPVDHRLVRSLSQSISQELGADAVLQGVTFGADAGLLQHVGATPVVLFGAGDIRRAHRPDEWVEIDQLETMARSLARTIVDFCGTM